LIILLQANIIKVCAMFRVHYLTFGLSRCRGGVTFFLDEKSHQKKSRQNDLAPLKLREGALVIRTFRDFLRVLSGLSTEL